MSVEAINAKQVVVDEITSKLENAKSAVVVEYRGLTVAEVTELRRNLRKEDVEMKVYKNTLVYRAAESLGYGDIKSELEGPNAVVFGHSDAVAPARVLADYAKKHKALVLKGAIVEGKVLNSDQVLELSKLPNREGMYSMLLGCLQAPMSKFARTLKAVAEAKGGPAEEPAEAAAE